MNRPNIFKYATKELSQDAMICWFLECLNSEDEEYRQLGLNFVRFIFNDNEIKVAKLFNNSFPKTQHEKIDVYAEILINNNILHPVIFEDKTNTYLHNDQMYKYIEKINNETNDKKRKNFFGEVELSNILYIYFKTGFASDWERCDIKEKQTEVQNGNQDEKNKKDAITNVSFREIYLKEMFDFLESIQTDDILFNDYKNYLVSIKNTREEYLEKYKDSTTECNNALKESNEQITVLLLEEIFGKGCWIEYTPHQHRGIVYPFYTISTKHKGKDDYRIFYNFGITCYKDNYYFRLKQWRKESKWQNDLKAKIEDAQKVQRICREIYNEINHKKITVKFNDKLKQTANKTFDSQEIFRINFDENYSANVIDICSFLKTFIKKLNQKVKADLNAEPLDAKTEKAWESKEQK